MPGRSGGGAKHFSKIRRAKPKRTRGQKYAELMRTKPGDEYIAWDTSSINAMERTAQEEVDGTCSKRIRGEWLEVIYNRGTNDFSYKWGKNYVTRVNAVNVLESNK